MKTILFVPFNTIVTTGTTACDLFLQSKRAVLLSDVRISMDFNGYQGFQWFLVILVDSPAFSALGLQKKSKTIKF